MKARRYIRAADGVEDDSDQSVSDFDQQNTQNPFGNGTIGSGQLNLNQLAPSMTDSYDMPLEYAMSTPAIYPGMMPSAPPSSGAAPASPNGPPMPAYAQYQQLAANPPTYSPPSWKRAILAGLISAAPGRFRPLGRAIGSEIMATEPNQVAYQNQLLALNLAKQRADEERGVMMAKGMLGYRDLGRQIQAANSQNAAFRAANTANAALTNEGAQPIPYMGAPTPSGITTGVQGNIPDVSAPNTPVMGDLSPGMQAAFQANTQAPGQAPIATYQQRNRPVLPSGVPGVGERVQIPTTEDKLRTEVITPQMSDALAGMAKNPQDQQAAIALRGQHVTKDQFNDYKQQIAAAQHQQDQNLSALEIKQFQGIIDGRWQINHPGEETPDQFTLGDDATQKDYDRISKALAGEESAESTKAARTAAQANRDAALAARSNKVDTALTQAVLKQYQPAVDSAERFNVMTKNYEDAIKNHDQQAMLSLLANHLGMTMGLQKGSRLTRDIIREAETSRPWLQGMQSKFDNHGYLTGVTLSPDQMRQMVSLGRERFSEDISKSRSASAYLGAKDDGPTRMPNKSTMRYYLAQTGGDVAKAKQLAQGDGWTVQ